MRSLQPVRILVTLLFYFGDKTISKTSLEIKSKDKTEKVLTSCSFSGGGVTITVNCECTGAVCRKVLAKIVAEL